MFTIVEWVASSDVSAVPSNWLFNDKEGAWSFWPSTTSDEESNSISNSGSPKLNGLNIESK